MREEPLPRGEAAAWRGPPARPEAPASVGRTCCAPADTVTEAWGAACAGDTPRIYAPLPARRNPGTVRVGALGCPGCEALEAEVRERRGRGRHPPVGRGLLPPG